MANNINNLAISKFFGIRIITDRIISNDVYIPNDAIKQRDKKMKEYRENIKKYRHANIKDKVKNTLKKESPLSYYEGGRRKKLQEIFKKTLQWMEDFADFFSDCKGNQTTKKYIAEIYKDFEALKKKGYVKDIPERDFERFDEEETKAYCLADLYIDKRYGYEISQTYNDLYDSFYILLNNKTAKHINYNDEFEKIRKDTKKYQKIKSLVFEDAAEYADDLLNKYEESYSKLNNLIQEYDIKNNPILKTKKKKLFNQYDEYVESLRSTIYNLARYRSRAEFSWSFPDDVNTNIATTIGDCQRKLNEFYKNVTNNYEIKKLKSNYKKLNDCLFVANEALKTFTSGSDKTQDSRTTLSDRVNDIMDKLNEKRDDIKKAKTKFDTGIDEFEAKCEEWKKEQKEKKTKITIYAVLGAFGVLCTAVKAFFPLIDAALTVEPVPVAPAGGQPQ